MKARFTILVAILCCGISAQVAGYDASITNCYPVAGGFKLEWISGGEAVVQWSPDLMTPFSNLSPTLPVGQGNYTDTVHGNDDKCFYLVELLTPGGMVLIPAGSNSGTNPLAPGESYHPQGYPASYSLTVSAFYMDTIEVTNDEMVEVMQWAYDNGRLTVSSTSVKNALGDPQELLDLDADACRITWNGAMFGIKSAKGSGYPCVYVSWFGAAAYCNFKSEMEGRTPCYNLSDWNCNLSAGGYRLPSSEEWEYAARGGLNSKRFPWGDTITHDQANYFSSDSWSYDVSATRGYHPSYNNGEAPYISPAGSFAANGYGLYDMAGNVEELCNDWYPGGEGLYRVKKDACWSNQAIACRAAWIFSADHYALTSFTGFRTVLPAE